MGTQSCPGKRNLLRRNIERKDTTFGSRSVSNYVLLETERLFLARQLLLAINGDRVLDNTHAPIHILMFFHVCVHISMLRTQLLVLFNDPSRSFPCGNGC